MRRWEQIVDTRQLIDIVQVISWNGQSFSFSVAYLSTEPEQIMENHIILGPSKELNQTQKPGLMVFLIPLGYTSIPTMRERSSTVSIPKSVKTRYICGLDHIQNIPRRLTRYPSLTTGSW